METPPNTGGLHRGANFMHFRRGEGEEDVVKNDMMSKFGPKYQFYKKETNPILAERENMNKIMIDLKKHVGHLENSRWMFENNGEMIPTDHFTNISL